jgi:hypothetical protein
MAGLGALQGLGAGLQEVGGGTPAPQAVNCISYRIYDVYTKTSITKTSCN